MALDKKSDQFGTPDHIFKPLNKRYKFTLDAAATAQNAKCKKFFTKEDDALSQSWAGERVWCNPPYSKAYGTTGHVELFCLKAFEETAIGCELAVLLIPNRTEQEWYGKLIRSGRVWIEDFKGRVNFIGGEQGARGTHHLMTIWPPLDFFHCVTEID